MKKIFLLVVLAISTVFVANAQKKTGYVNSTEIMQALPEYKKAMTDYETFVNKLQADYEALGKEYETKVKDFEAKASTMTEAMKEVKIKEIQNLQTSLQSFEAKVQDEMQKKEADLMRPLFEKVNKAIEAVGKNQGYDYIYNMQALLFAKDSENITGAVKTQLGIK